MPCTTYDIFTYSYLHIINVFDGKCRFIYHAAPLSWYELHQSSKVTTFECFFSRKKMRCHDFPWRLLRENRTPPPQEALQAPWMTSSSWRWCAMTSHTGPRHAKTRKKSMNLPHCVCLRRPFWRHSCILSQETSLKVRFTGLYYIWLSRTEPWIVFSLHV